MFIDIGKISDKGFCIQLTRKDKWAMESTAHALDAEVTDLSVRLEASLEGHKAVVWCEIDCVFKATCSRCMCPLTVSLSGNQELVYMPAAPMDAQGPQSVAELEQIKEEIELEEDDLDIGWYFGSKLDLSAILCEAVVLLSPSRVRCGMNNTKRLEPGECRRFDKKQPQMTHKPFANLKLP